MVVGGCGINVEVLSLRRYFIFIALPVRADHNFRRGAGFNAFVIIVLVIRIQLLRRTLAYRHTGLISQRVTVLSKFTKLESIASTSEFLQIC